MEEEDFPYPTPFFLQSANNPNPKQQKQPKTSISKCNCNPSSSITQQKNLHTCSLQTSNSQVKLFLFIDLNPIYFSYRNTL
jgi:hypothetical protein